MDREASVHGCFNNITSAVVHGVVVCVFAAVVTAVVVTKVVAALAVVVAVVSMLFQQHLFKKPLGITIILPFLLTTLNWFWTT